MKAITSLVLVGLLVISTAAAEPKLSFLHTDGLRIVNEVGAPIALRGYNLGGWLLLEPWIVKLNNQPGITCEKDIWDMIAKRFGADKMREAVTTYRQSFIQESDLDQLQQLGVNFVRLPIWWRVLGDPTYDVDGWHYVDQLLDWCERRGIYVLLDLHGAPGGQNGGADILGERPDGTYWNADSKHRVETAEWWKKVARRYADRSVIAGYDLLNEANTAPSMSVLANHMDEIYRAIREIDSRHIIFIQDGLLGYYRLPIPSDMGWKNVVYSFHFYPEDGFAFAERDTAGVRAAQLRYGVPVNIGECNIFSLARGGVSALDRSLQVCNELGWSWNLWSYKVLEDNADYLWGLTGYFDRRVPTISLNDSKYEDVVDYLRRCASKNWKANQLVEACVRKQTKATEPITETRAGETPLLPKDATLISQDSKGGLRVEWQWPERNLGFWGPDDSAAWKIVVPTDGTYAAELDYSAETNSPVVRLFIDGVSAGTTTLPPTGKWSTYRNGPVPCGHLFPGIHILRIASGGGDSFLNLRAMKLVQDAETTHETDGNVIELTPAEIAHLGRKNQLCVEWEMRPPNIGYWSEGEPVQFKFQLPRPGKYTVAFNWSSPNPKIVLQITANGKAVGSFNLVGTGGWRSHEWQRATESIALSAGSVQLEVIPTKVSNKEGAGNLRVIRFERMEESDASSAPEK